jgi:hypothetical protein
VASDWARAAEEQAERSQSLSWMEMKTDTVYGPQSDTSASVVEP